MAPQSSSSFKWRAARLPGRAAQSSKGIKVKKPRAMPLAASWHPISYPAEPVAGSWRT